MAKKKVDQNAAMVMLQQMAKLMGLDVEYPTSEPEAVPEAAAEPVKKNSAVKAKRTYTSKNGTVYGKAPVVKDANGIENAKLTAAAREMALNACIPGILKACWIAHVGRDANKKDERTFSRMVNIPFTYIEFPGGKKQKIGSMEPQDVREALKGIGYGWSNFNKCWGCDSKGNPLHRVPNHKATGSGRAALDDVKA